MARHAMSRSSVRRLNKVPQAPPLLVQEGQEEESRTLYDGVRVSIDPGSRGPKADLTVDQMDIRYEPFFEPDGTPKSMVHFSGIVRVAKLEGQNPLMGEDPNPMQTVYETWRSCRACSLHKYRTNLVFGEGNAIDPSILIIGEAPGPKEDEEGRPFVGPTGQLLRSALDEVGVHVDRDCYITNSVCCFPKDEVTGSFRGPLGQEVLTCRERLRAQFRVIAPSLKVVLLLGKRGFAAFTRPDSLKTGQLNEEKGWNSIKMKDVIGWYTGPLPRAFGDLKVYTTWHPSYIARQQQSRARALPTEWKLDLQAVAAYALRGEFTDPRVRKP